MSSPKLSKTVYQSKEVVHLAHFFLGKQLCVYTEEGLTGGLITETEAYGGAEDKACHAYGNRRTKRTEIMFAPGGVAYVYLCYGLHFLFNIITGPRDNPMAVLIRGVHINQGEALVFQRRGHLPPHQWANGPGKVSQALGIQRSHDGCSLTGNAIWLEDPGTRVPPEQIEVTPRIGIAYAEEWAHVPWRFVWKPHELSPSK